MADLMFTRKSELNPDEDFVLHGRSTAYWERRDYVPNSELTTTTARLSQHGKYDSSSYRPKERVYARSMTDLANNLEVMSKEVDHTLAGGKAIDDARIEREIMKELEYQKSLRKEIKAEQFTLSRPDNMLRTDVTEDELVQLYEDHIGEVENLSNKPKSPRDAQWYTNPNHLKGHTEAPTLQSIGKTYRYGSKSKTDYADKDRIAFKHFPVTFGSSYEMCAQDYPASEPMNVSAPPSMRRAKSATTRYCTFRSYDRSFNDKADIDRMYLLTKEAPVIGSSGVYVTSPHQLILGKLRLERLQLEEAKLLEAKRKQELERTRGPRPKWYMSKGPDFHYEANKNNNLVHSMSRYQDMLDYREDLLRSSYENLKKYTRQPIAA